MYVGRKAGLKKTAMQTTTCTAATPQGCHYSARVRRPINDVIAHNRLSVPVTWELSAISGHVYMKLTQAKTELAT